MAIGTRAHQQAFLAAFAQTASISKAAIAARIGRKTHYIWLQKSPAYAKAFAEADQLAGEALEAEAVRRAHEGVKRPVFYKGVEVGCFQEYSDKLLELLLRARFPDKYRERSEIKLVNTEALTARLVAGRDRMKQSSHPPC